MSLLDAVERVKAQKMARAMAEARRNSLKFRIPENIADDNVSKTIDISLKVWDVLNGLLEIAATAKLAVGAWGAAKISVEAIAASEAAAQAAATVGLSSKVTTAFDSGRGDHACGPIGGLRRAVGRPWLALP
jgi:hypothetical protein